MGITQTRYPRLSYWFVYWIPRGYHSGKWTLTCIARLRWSVRFRISYRFPYCKTRKQSPCRKCFTVFENISPLGKYCSVCRTLGTIRIPRNNSPSLWIFSKSL